MDTFEDTFPQEPVPVPPEGPSQEPAQPSPQPSAAPQPAPEPVAEPAPQPASEPVAEPVPRPAPKASPYADSPYQMQHREPRWQYQPQTQPPAKPPRKPKQPRRGTPWLATIALVLVGCLITALCVSSYWEQQTSQILEQFSGQVETLQRQIAGNTPQTPGSTGPSVPTTSGSAMTPAQLYGSCVDSVVAISSTVESQMYGQTMEGTSSGSGFVLTENGYVVTNYHVVEGATTVRVVTHDGEEYAAEVVGYDSSNDIAVLKAEAEGLSPAAIGSSSALNIGDMVVAIGNPLGTLAATQTVGYVSGINREVTTDSSIINMIQTDAAINPGNSGGPLFNMQGQVIGITTAKYSGTTNSGASIEGIGFAIPIDDVAGMISDLVDYGYVTGAFLGVSVTNNDAESAAMFGLPTTGAYVVSVEPGASADRAGIQVKDLIIELGGYKISTVTDLTRTLRHFQAGDITTITIIRSGVQQTLSITLDEKPRDTTPTLPEQAQMPDEGDWQQWYDYFRRYFGE